MTFPNINFFVHLVHEPLHFEFYDATQKNSDKSTQVKTVAKVSMYKPPGCSLPFLKNDQGRKKMK